MQPLLELKAAALRYKQHKMTTPQRPVFLIFISRRKTARQHGGNASTCDVAAAAKVYRNKRVNVELA
jgi:hypothetical protein